MNARGSTGDGMGFQPIATVYKAGSAYVRTMPRPVSTLTGAVASRILIGSSVERRTLVERNLRRAYGPGFGGSALRRSVLETFRSYSRYWIDSFRLPDLSVAELDAGFSFEGVGEIHDARSEERRVGKEAWAWWETRD